MFFVEILLSIALGCVLGTITGLIPGIHINLVSAIVIGSVGSSVGVSPVILALVIVSMAVTHTFLDFIPAFFTSIPDSDTMLSTLPAHTYMREGKVHEAVLLTVIGSLGCLLLTLLFAPAFLWIISQTYGVLKKYIGLILIQTVLFLIFKEQGSKVLAFMLFFLSGVLGVIVLDMPIQNPFLPLFSGLFGLPLLIINVNKKIVIPKQIVTFPALKMKETGKTILTAVCSGAVFSLLPGMGPSQAAVVGSQFIKIAKSTILILLGGINTVNMVVSFLTLYSINKARNGAVVAIAKIIPALNIKLVILFLAASLVAAFVATTLTITVSKIFAKLITKVNYKKLILIIISAVSGLVFWFTGWVGIVIMLTGTCIGLIPNIEQVHRNHLMGCLLLPIILFFML